MAVQDRTLFRNLRTRYSGPYGTEQKAKLRHSAEPVRNPHPSFVLSDPPDSRHAGPRSFPPPALREPVRASAENRPGVYRFLGPRGEVLYVGKSVRIRTRLLSYFRREPRGKLRELLRVAEGVEWEYAPNEFEALLREFRQIRAFRPRFNVRHRRERRWAWVKLTREPAPRLLASRRPSPDGSRWFGPFPAGRGLPDTLRDLSRTMGLRDCPRDTPLHFADQLDLLGNPLTPLCSRAGMGSCPGPCAGLCSREGYQENVRRVVAFLEGRDDAPLELLRARMEAAAGRRDFELAGRLRDRIEDLRQLRDSIGSFTEHLKSLTFVYRPAGAEGGGEYADPAVGRQGYLIVQGRVRWTFPWPAPGETDATLAPTLERLRREPATPPEGLSPTDREELFLVARWFRDRPVERERTLPPGDLSRILQGRPARKGFSPSCARASG
jgi:excinuclease ABC subunit C